MPASRAAQIAPVSAIGSGVTGLSVGDRVLAAAQGGFAEYAVARRDSGDETGDTASVVGYAGVIVSEKEDR